MDFEKLYPVTEETAGLMQMKLGTLRQYVSRGVIPALYIGSKRLAGGPHQVIAYPRFEVTSLTRPDGK